MNQRIHKLLALLGEGKEDDFLLFAIAKEYFKIADFDHSIAYFEKLITSNQAYTGAYYHYALTLITIDNEEEALKIIERGIAECTINEQLHDKKELMSLIIDYNL